MQRSNVRHLRHDHVFGQDRRHPGERRTLLVIVLTAATMVLEVTTGLLFGSMALLADGLHMGSHAVALGITAFAYRYARAHASDIRFSFGTGKVNALGGFAGALLLGVFSLTMAWESVSRLFAPVAIAFDQAIAVAVVGLLVNGLSMLILGGEHQHHGHGHDHNLRSAYLHVLADALTSLLAILALLAGKYLALSWMDPVTGVLGAVLVAHWSLGLIGASSATLLDHQAPPDVVRRVRAALEAGGSDEVADLHLWSVGPGMRAAEVVLVTGDDLTPQQVKARLPRDVGVVHSTVEIHRQRAA